MADPATDNPALRADPSYKEFTYTLDAGAEVSIYSDCNVITCLEATADFSIAFDGGSRTNFKPGLSYRAPRVIRDVRVENTSGSANTITLALAKGDIRDARLVLDASAGTIATEETAATWANYWNGSISAGAFVGPVGAAARRGICVAALDTNVGLIWVTPSGSAAKRGIPLAPGAFVILAAKSSVYLYNPNGASCDATISEFT